MERGFSEGARLVNAGSKPPAPACSSGEFAFYGGEPRDRLASSCS
jgi:hypothetical protein